MNKKIILLSLLTIVGVLGAGQMVSAASTALSVSPASLNNVVGTPFNVSVQVNPENNKVCAVRGTIDFKGLDCQNITLASGLMTVITPTCASPSFLVGIPKCTINVQNLFSVSVKGNKAGASTLSFTSVRIMGEGTGISSVWQGGAYNITAAAKPVVVPVPKATQRATTRITQSTPAPVATIEVANPTEQTTTDNNIPTGVGEPAGQQASLATTPSAKTITIISIILLVLAIAGGAWYLISRKKK